MKDSIAKLSELIDENKVAMMTTVGKDGVLYSRPMVNQALEEEGTLWFFSRDDSPKTEELLHNSDVNLSYSDPSKNLFVSISGTASVLHDSQKATELWKPHLRAWFPNGLEDPHLSLIRVDIETAEYWEGPTNPVTRLIGMAKTYLSGGKATMGENEILDFGRSA